MSSVGYIGVCDGRSVCVRYVLCGWVGCVFGMVCGRDR